MVEIVVTVVIVNAQDGSLSQSQRNALATEDRQQWIWHREMATVPTVEVIMINEFQKFPTDKDAYDRSYERIFGKAEKRVSEETKSITATLSNTDVRNELNLPNSPEECDLSSIHEEGCPLEEAKDNCKGCIIGRKNNGNGHNN